MVKCTSQKQNVQVSVGHIAKVPSLFNRQVNPCGKTRLDRYVEKFLLFSLIGPQWVYGFS